MKQNSKQSFPSPPDTAWKLIELAIKDLQVCHADPNLEIDMRHWVRVTETNCTHCVAGAVMLQTLGLVNTLPKKPETIVPSDYLFPDSWYQRFSALDYFRRARLFDGLCSYYGTQMRFKDEILEELIELEQNMLRHFVHLNNYKEKNKQFQILIEMLEVAKETLKSHEL